MDSQCNQQPTDPDKEQTELDMAFIKDGSNSEQLKLQSGQSNLDPKFPESVRCDQSISSKVQQNQNETSSKSDPSLCNNVTALTSLKSHPRLCDNEETVSISKSNPISASAAPGSGTSSTLHESTNIRTDTPKGRPPQNSRLETLCGNIVREMIFVSNFQKPRQPSSSQRNIPKLVDICYDRIHGAIHDPDKDLARLIKRDPKMSQRARDRLLQPNPADFPKLKDICSKRLLGDILFLDSSVPSLYNRKQIQQVYSALVGPHPPDFSVHPNQVNDIPWGEFHDEHKRLATYLLYPLNAAKRPVFLAKSGFVYIGEPCSDSVICYYCNRIKSTWLSGDCIQLQHRPNCIQFNQP